MNKGTVLASALLLPLALVACRKQEPAADVVADTAPAAPAPAAVTEPAAAPPPAEVSEAQAKLDYATMEDGYINDAKAQWATSAKASSAFGDANALPPDSQDQNTAWQATGGVNGRAWTNNNQNIGFDWIELAFERPAPASGVRVVVNDNAAASITRVELIDAAGTAHPAWSGISDVKQDERGPRTWFVRTFDATPYPVRAVKLTFANNVASGYKEVDAVQLVAP